MATPKGSCSSLRHRRCRSPGAPGGVPPYFQPAYDRQARGIPTRARNSPFGLDYFQPLFSPQASHDKSIASRCPPRRSRFGFVQHAVTGISLRPSLLGTRWRRYRRSETPVIRYVLTGLWPILYRSSRSPDVDFSPKQDHLAVYSLNRGIGDPTMASRGILAFRPRKTHAHEALPVN